MREMNISKLSSMGIRSIIRHQETLIAQQQANFDDYELFVQCQRELILRQARTQDSDGRRLGRT